jgi:hypothetical protein
MFDTVFNPNTMGSDAPSNPPTMRIPAGFELRVRSRSQSRGLKSEVGPDWDDCMASSFAYLRSALSGIEDLLKHPETSLSDRVSFVLASTSVSLALAALDAGNPELSQQQPERHADTIR